MTKEYSDIGLYICIFALIIPGVYCFINYVKFYISNLINPNNNDHILYKNEKDIDHKYFLRTNPNKEFDYSEFWHHGFWLQDKFKVEQPKEFKIQRQKAIQEKTCISCIYSGAISDGCATNEPTAVCTKYNLFNRGASSLGLRYKYCKYKTIIGPVETFEKIKLDPEMTYASLFMYLDVNNLSWDGDCENHPVRVLVEKKENE